MPRTRHNRTTPVGRSPHKAQSVTPTLEFPHTWSVEVLKTAPLIAPARQFTYPQQIAGEEDALARGALQLLVHPVTGGTFLANCALGFTDKSMPTGVGILSAASR